MVPVCGDVVDCERYSEAGEVMSSAAAVIRYGVIAWLHIVNKPKSNLQIPTTP